MTPSEVGRLSLGLARALDRTGARPRIVSHPHPSARLSAAWRGATPVLTRHDVIFWPDARPDLTALKDARVLATLQHELQHVLDYRTGRLTAARYLADPREWTYAVEIDQRTTFDRLGAEQRATLAEQLWLAENGYRPPAEIEALRAIIPWASQDGSRAVGDQGAA